MNANGVRVEEDFLGQATLPAGVLYGIHACRAEQVFGNASRFSMEWYRAVGLVKQACYQTVSAFLTAAAEKYPEAALPYGCDDPRVFLVLEEAAAEVAAGDHFDHFIVPAVQGGAGTSINMNINEIICNVALCKSGAVAGEYAKIDPIVHANIFQSTNDVVPTALKLAVMQQLGVLEATINGLRTGMEQLETAHRSSLRMAHTQMQQAVPSSFGLLFSAFADALSRDWWRVSKCFERIKVVNLGGGAAGTGIAIPRFFIMEATTTLQRLSGLPLTRGENLVDTTQNLDVYVEVHATLKAHAVNLEKIASDLRMLGSDLAGQQGVGLPRKLTGSSIMPGKVNPVVSEFVICCAHKVYSNDMLISSLCGQGCLDLNPYLPVIGSALLESLHLLNRACRSLDEHLVAGLKVTPGVASDRLLHSPAITTALLPHIGYNKAAELAAYMRTHKVDVQAANTVLKFLGHEALAEILRPENLLKLGYSLAEI